MVDFFKFGRDILFVARFNTRPGSIYRMKFNKLYNSSLGGTNIGKILKSKNDQDVFINVACKSKQGEYISYFDAKNSQGDTIFKGAYSLSRDKKGLVEKYHFNDLGKLYNDFKYIKEPIKHVISPPKRKPISKEQILELKSQGLNQQQLARALKVGNERIRQLISFFKLEPRKIYKEKPEKKQKITFNQDEICEVIATQKTRKAAAEVLNIKIRELDRFIKKFHINVKAVQKSKFIELFNQGKTKEEICKEMNMNSSRYEHWLREFKRR